MGLVDVVAAGGTDPRVVLRLAGALESASEHPIAQAVAKRAAEEAGTLPGVEGFRSLEGLGVEGAVDGHAVVVGRPALLKGRGLSLPPELADARATVQDKGQTCVAVGWDGQARGRLVVSDAVKPTSGAAVAQLRRLGLTRYCSPATTRRRPTP